jgi:hypothetical protein
MNRFRSFLRLSKYERWLLLEAAVLLAAVRLCLGALPFGLLHRLSRVANQLAREMNGVACFSPERVGWAIAVAGNHVPASTCLAQAIAGEVLLSRHGYESTLHIGVAKGNHGQLEAHAWLESGDRVVIGGSQDLTRYTLLPALDRLRVMENH